MLFDRPPLFAQAEYHQHIHLYEREEHFNTRNLSILHFKERIILTSLFAFLLFCFFLIEQVENGGESGRGEKTDAGEEQEVLEKEVECHVYNRGEEKRMWECRWKGDGGGGRVGRRKRRNTWIGGMWMDNIDGGDREGEMGVMRLGKEVQVEIEKERWG